ncbi:hypothetical protein L485_22330 [Sphingobium baderi LL03]|uniref:Uncharacterized protein n=1 Tax=Sphingobium baderi LL03 TaxID=1114964 RepID=T0GA03_9SPHN|nr:hypothetical protein L485_22330 [Sphingobium baderi LL03]
MRSCGFSENCSAGSARPIKAGVKAGQAVIENCVLFSLNAAIRWHGIVPRIEAGKAADAMIAHADFPLPQWKAREICASMSAQVLPQCGATP